MTWSLKSRDIEYTKARGKSVSKKTAGQRRNWKAQNNSGKRKD